MSEPQSGYNPYNPEGQRDSKILKILAILLTAGFIAGVIGNQYRNAHEYCDSVAEQVGTETTLHFSISPPFYTCTSDSTGTAV